MKVLRKLASVRDHNLAHATSPKCIHSLERLFFTLPCAKSDRERLWEMVPKAALGWKSQGMMMKAPIVFGALVGGLVLAAGSASAQTAIKSVFFEGAPRDRFLFTNIGNCDLGPMRLTLDLSMSEAGLIFDTTGGGAGVEVFQPLELETGQELVSQIGKVTDGDTRVSLDLLAFPAKESFSFTVDIDDTLGDSALGQIRVSDAEMTGAAFEVFGLYATFGGSAAVTEDFDCPLP